MNEIIKLLDKNLKYVKHTAYKEYKYVLNLIILKLNAN